MLRAAEGWFNQTGPTTRRHMQSTYSDPWRTLHGSATRRPWCSFQKSPTSAFSNVSEWLLWLTPNSCRLQITTRASYTCAPSFSAQLLLQPPEHVILAVRVTPMCGPVHGTSAVDALVLHEFDRAAPRGVGAGKLGGGLRASVALFRKGRRSRVRHHLASRQ